MAGLIQRISEARKDPAQRSWVNGWIVLLTIIGSSLIVVAVSSFFSSSATEASSDLDESRFPEPIDGAAETMGLKYFPDSTRTFTYVDLDDKYAVNELKGLSGEWATLLTVLSSRLNLNLTHDFDSVSLGVIARQQEPWDLLELKDNPKFLMIATTNRRIDSNPLLDDEEFQRSMVSGKPFFSFERYTIGFPTEKTIAVGDRHEVLFAVLSHNHTSHFRRFSWLDPKRNCWIQMDQRGGAALANRRTSIATLLTDSQTAMLTAEEENNTIALEMGEMSTEDYLSQKREAASQLGNEWDARKEAREQRRAETIEDRAMKQREQRETQGQAHERIPATKYLARGNAMIQEIDYSRTAEDGIQGGALLSFGGRPRADVAQRVPSEVPACLALIRELNAESRDNRGHRKRLDVRLRFEKIVEEAGAGNAQAIGPLRECFQSTSNHELRKDLIGELAARCNDVTVQLIGEEARYGDLKRALNSVAIEKLSPDDFADGVVPTAVAGRLSGRFIESCKYYLSTPGDPATTMSICHIAADLGAKELESAIKRLQDDQSQSEQIRAIAKSALDRLRDPSLPDIKQIRVPRSPDVVIRWLSSELRVDRQLAFNVMSRDGIPEQGRAEIIARIVELLDDAVFCDRAHGILVQNISDDEVDLVREVVKAATSGGEDAPTHDRTVYRAVSVLGSAKDGQGLRVAIVSGDFKLSKYAGKVMRDNNIPNTAVIDEIWDSMDGTSQDSARMLQMRALSLSLTVKEKAHVRKRALQYFHAGHRNEDLWDGFRLCDPYHKEMVPLLVHCWVASPDNNNYQYLTKYGPSIETMMIAEIEKYNASHEEKFGELWACEMLKTIGTEKSVPLLKTYIRDPDTGELILRVQKAIGTIRKFNRKEMDFESFPQPKHP